MRRLPEPAEVPARPARARGQRRSRRRRADRAGVADQAPERAPFAAAVVGSLIWFALCAYYGYQRSPHYLRPRRSCSAGIGAVPAGRAGAVAAVVRLRRALAPAAGLRQSAASIAHVAVRLAEPESMASEQFSTLAQAIRREVANMGDGVERAFARAAELEGLVRNEMPALERSSGEHERRLRALIAELADQREAILANGELVRNAIADAHGGAGARPEVGGRAASPASRRHRPFRDHDASAPPRTSLAQVDRARQRLQARLGSSGVGDEIAKHRRVGGDVGRQADRRGGEARYALRSAASPSSRRSAAVTTRSAAVSPNPPNASSPRSAARAWASSSSSKPRRTPPTKRSPPAAARSPRASPPAAPKR